MFLVAGGEPKEDHAEGDDLESLAEPHGVGHVAAKTFQQDVAGRRLNVVVQEPDATDLMRFDDILQCSVQEHVLILRLKHKSFICMG